jgi:carbon starvation protein
MVFSVFFGGVVLLILGYVFYGRVVSRWIGVDETSPTPAHSLRDDVDYVPTAVPVLFGHHFSSIAGAAPIVGPIVAAMWFGWLPAVVWIVLGAVFIGGVHDYSTLMASIRHGGRSIGEVCRDYLSPVTYKAFLAFIWLCLVYVLVVFMDLTAATFTAKAGGTDYALGGAVATSSLLYIAIALAFGLFLRGKKSVLAGTLIFVPLVFIAIYVGLKLPFTADILPALFHGDPKYTWCLILLAYCYIASITPVNVLLQPRDYLSSFLLYACLLGGGIGLVVATVSGTVSLGGTEFPAFLGWYKNAEQQTGFIFPLLFITIACGAVSGFHCVVASGTTAKQLPTEKAAKPIAFGGMIVEGILALLALATLMILSRDADVLKGPATGVFATGIGTFLKSLGLPEAAGRNFGLLAVSTFLLTTLDTATRLCRFILEELFALKKKSSRYLSTLATLILPALIVFSKVQNTLADGRVQTIPAWKAVWPAFGSTNQLLATLALLVVFMWLAHSGKRKAFVLIPTLLMLGVTLTGLTQLTVNSLMLEGGQKIVGGVCLAILILAVVILVDTVRHWRRIAEGARCG